jgi:hypothetical protein
MLVKRSQIRNLFAALDRTKYEMPISSIFRHMATKNVNILLNQINSMGKTFEAPAEYQEFSQKRDAILATYNLTTPVTAGSLTTEQEEKLNGELKALNAEYNDILGRMYRLNKEKEEYLSQEVDLPLIQISIKDMPTLAKDTENHWVVWSLLEKFVKDDA